MKAARFHGKRDVRVENVPEPDKAKLGPREVLVKNRYCGICGTDVRGSWCYSTLMWPRVASMIGTGILPAEKVVTRRIRLDDVVENGFEQLLSPTGQELKILIDLQ